MKLPGAPHHIASVSAAYRRRFPGRPSAVDIELTHRCGLRCPACWFHGEHGVGDRFAGAELSIDEVVSLLDQVASYKPSLYFGGGEPLLRPDFLEIVAEARSRDLRVAFTTNATLLTPEAAARLVESQVTAINVSIDGPEDAHDRHRGPGTFRRAVANLLGLLDAREQERAPLPAVIINITVNPGVAGRLGETIGLLREMSSDRIDWYRVHHLWFITPAELRSHREAVGRALGCSAEGAAAHLMPAWGELDIGALCKEVSGLRGTPKVLFLPDLDADGLAGFYAEGRPASRHCRASSRSLVVRPDGSVVFCPDEWIDGYVLGNVRQTALIELWRSARARHFRRVIHREGAFPACRRCSWLG